MAGSSNELDVKGIVNMKEVDQSNKCALRVLIHTMIQKITYRIRDIREMKVKKLIAVESLKKSAGENWKQSKYVYAISSIQTYLYRANECIADLLRTVDGFAQIASTIYQMYNIYIVMEMLSWSTKRTINVLEILIMEINGIQMIKIFSVYL